MTFSAMNMVSSSACCMWLSLVSIIRDLYLSQFSAAQTNWPAVIAEVHWYMISIHKSFFRPNLRYPSIFSWMITRSLPVLSDQSIWVFLPPNSTSLSLIFAVQRIFRSKFSAFQVDNRVRGSQSNMEWMGVNVIVSCIPGFIRVVAPAESR